MRRLMAFSILFLSSVMLSHAQASTITFYAPGSMWKGLGAQEITVGTYNRVTFAGSVFDGDERMGWLRHGHFVSFQVTPGHHIFSASYSSKHPANNATLPLDVEAGKNYFVGLRGKRYGALFVAYFAGIIEEKSCSEAFSEASGFEAAPSKWAAKEWRAKLINQPYFPKCDL